MTSRSWRKHRPAIVRAICFLAALSCETPARAMPLPSETSASGPTVRTQASCTGLSLWSLAHPDTPVREENAADVVKTVSAAPSVPCWVAAPADESGVDAGEDSGGA